MTVTETTTTPTPSTRSTLRTVLLIVGSIILVLVLVFTVLRIVSAMNREDTSGSYTVSDSYTSLRVDTTAAEVTIRVGDVTSTEIDFAQGSSNQQLSYDVKGDTLTVGVGNPFWGDNIGSFDIWPWDGGNKVTLTVTIPADAVGAITLDTTAGDVQLDGDFGDLDLTTTAGDLTLVGSADDVSIDTTAGTVTLDDFAVDGKLSSSSTAGDLRYELASLPKQIDVDSTAGDVLIALPDGSYRIETSSTAGEINNSVSSDASSKRVYRIETTAGDIELRQR